MKRNPIYLLPLVLLLPTVAAYAETPEFEVADQNSDGILSIGEANAALPELQISDDNGDGIVNHSEAEESVEGLDLPMSLQFTDHTIAPVGVSEYRMIVQAMTASSTDV